MTMLATAEDVQNEIEKIISTRAIEASEMPYDRRVWIAAVSEARRVLGGVTVDGTSRAYYSAVVSVLSEASDTYNDPDGEYTNGRGAIGNILYDVMRLVPE